MALLGGVPLFLNAVASATSNRASVVLRAQPKQPPFWPLRRRGGGGRGGGAASHRRRSRATAGKGDEETPFPFPSHLVRLATREDLPALVAIERACGHFEWGAEALRHELESPLATLLVAEVKEEEGQRRSLPSWTEESDDGEDKENEGRPGPSAAPPPPPSLSSSSPISGLAIVWTVADETQVLELAVHPARRRRGAARALLSAALASSPAARAASSSAFRSGGRAVLEVASRNDAAISLYRSFGFEVDGIRKGYYRDGDDALLMSLRIDGSEEREGEEEDEGEEGGPRRRRRSNDSAPSSPPTPPG